MERKQETNCVETKDQIGSCLKMLNVLKKSNDVKEIMRSLEEQNYFSFQQNIRRR